MYDAIIVGARCAGASTAMLLARKGYRVLLVDRNRFPSDLTLSTHLIWQPGVAALTRWGLVDEVAKSGCPALTTGVFDLGPFALSGRFPPADGVGEAYAPRRRVLDGILVEAATKAGVELWEGCTVDGLLVEEQPRLGQVVRGIRGRGQGGRALRATAAVVVGADGMRSVVARMVGAPAYNARPPLEGTYFTYWSGVPVTGSTLYPRDFRSVVTFPTNDDLTLVGVNWAIKDFPAVRADIAGQYHRAVAEAAPELAERLRAGTREQRWAGTAIPSFFLRPYGPGWALVGDAGYVKDPCTAQGITDAFHHAELLADALDAAWSGRAALGEALADYERRRNEAVGPMYEFTSQLASFEPPSPQLRELFGALAGDQARTDRFFGVFAGTVPVQEFFGSPAREAA
jgi:2-polyprenyl-6-methoxyphenol hydroxylase-like FAD-dependent oxidoreductase